MYTTWKWNYVDQRWEEVEVDVCCEKFEEVLKQEDILFKGGRYDIYGRPYPARGGDPDAREWMISFCPFCGEKL